MNDDLDVDVGVDVAQFKKINIPLMKRVYPQLIANKICNVQPLSVPSSLKYYLQEFGGPVDDSWIIKSKKKKIIWRDINDPWEPSNNG